MRKGKQRTPRPHLCIHTDPTHGPDDPEYDDYTYSHRCTCLTFRFDHPSTEAIQEKL